MRRSLIGTRIRQQRRRLGISQTALAKQSGISTSYLNLIEHNKRGIAGKVLLSIARELDVSASSLAEETDSEITGALQEAAAYAQDQSAETDILAEFAGRYPGWSNLLVSIYRQVRDQENVISALSDRLTHDPFLAESLHLMLSNITAIRSSAGILTSVDDISDDQRTRFYSAIHDESKRLSGAAQALIDYFDKSADLKTHNVTPEEELDAFLQAHNYNFPTLDADDVEETDIQDILDLSADRLGVTARKMAVSALDVYRVNAEAMPLQQFSTSAINSGFNPSALAVEFETTLHAVFRRLACLGAASQTAPNMGLIIVNAAGHALYRQPLQEFPLPRHGNACPIWPVYQCFSQPERPFSAVIELPTGNQFLTLSIASPRKVASFGSLPDYQSAMLIIPIDQTEASTSWLPANPQPHPVGTSCRICPRENCASRSEETVF